MKTRREEYMEATRQALIDAARAAFAESGYADASTEVISRAARVTRGAFYHHFEDKKALFDAVVVAMQREATEKILAASKRERGLQRQLWTGIDAYLDVCSDADYARIVVQDAPNVLGEARFREIDEAWPMSLLLANLTALKARGHLHFQDVPLLTRLVDAMICKLAITLPFAEDRAQYRADGVSAVQTFVRGFLAEPE